VSDQHSKCMSQPVTTGTLNKVVFK